MASLIHRTLVPLFAVACLVHPAASARAGPHQAGQTQAQPAPAESDSWRFTPAPETDILPPYIADPYRSVFALQSMAFLDSEIPQSGNRRWGLKLGGQLGLVHFYPADAPHRGWQVNLEASIRGVFDQDHSTDNIGWDGVYGLQLAWRPADDIAYQVGVHHNSAHVGDEYAERTGRQRIDYTRSELRAGMAFGPAPRWTAYADAGYGYSLRSETRQAPWRVHGGLQYEHPPVLFGGGFGAYGGVDIAAFQENDWDAGVSVQTGIAMPVKDRVWRTGVEYYNGRSTSGEFFFRDEEYVLLGLWLEL